MDIPNLSQPAPQINTKKQSPLPIYIIITTLAITSGFFLSRYFPSSKDGSSSLGGSNNNAISSDKISKKEDVQVGKLYGNSEKNFKDSATGTIEDWKYNQGLDIDYR